MQDFLFAVGVLAVFATMVLVSRLVAKRAWGHKADIHEFHEPETGELDEEAMGMLDGLTEWLQNERIIRTMLETGTATKDALQTTYLALPVFNANQIRSTAKALLRDRNVRRVIAIEFMRKRNMPTSQHSQVLAGLAQWAQIEPPLRVVDRSA